MTDDPFYDRLREQLDIAYQEAPLRPGSLAATTRAGRRRQHRRRRVGAATAAAAVGVGGATVAWLSRPANPRVDTVDRPTTPTSGPTPSTEGPVAAGITLTTAEPALTWRRIDPDSTAAVASPLEASYTAALPTLPGVMLSTAPGRSPERQLWRSDDGITWTEVGGLPDGATAADSWTGTGGRIYALGTMPGSAPGAYDAYVSTSLDGGLTWSGDALATDNSEMAALPGVEGVNTGIDGVVGAGDVVLALVHQSADVPNLEGLMRSARLDLEDAGWEATVAGLTVRSCTSASTIGGGPDEDSGCHSEEVAWSQMGSAGPTLRAALLGQPRLFVSTDGGPFTEVAVPGAGQLESYQLHTFGDSVLLIGGGHDTGRRAMWESSDGRHWTELTPPPVDGAVVQLPGNQLVALGTGESTMAIMRDGATWEQGSWRGLFGDDVAYVHPAATDASQGITAAAMIHRPPTRRDEVATSEPPPPTIENEPVFSHYEILHSVDGVAWSRESVADLVGVDNDAISSVTRVQTAGDTVVVAVNLTAAEGEIPKQVVLVGTPRG
jgi:hypothetical protein